mgnify:CR=1 FL=1
MAKVETERERLLLEAPYKEEWNLAQNDMLPVTTNFGQASPSPNKSSVDTLCGNLGDELKHVSALTSALQDWDSDQRS